MISTKQWEVITEEGNNDGKKKLEFLLIGGHNQN